MNVWAHPQLEMYFETPERDENFAIYLHEQKEAVSSLYTIDKHVTSSDSFTWRKAKESVSFWRGDLDLMTLSPRAGKFIHYPLSLNMTGVAQTLLQVLCDILNQ